MPCLEETVTQQIVLYFSPSFPQKIVVEHDTALPGIATTQPASPPPPSSLYTAWPGAPSMHILLLNIKQTTIKSHAVV